MFNSNAFSLSVPSELKTYGKLCKENQFEKPHWLVKCTFQASLIFNLCHIGCCRVSISTQINSKLMHIETLIVIIIFKCTRAVCWFIHSKIYTLAKRIQFNVYISCRIFYVDVSRKRCSQCDRSEWDKQQNVVEQMIKLI